MKIAFVNPPHADWILPNFATWFYMQSHYNSAGKYKDKVTWLNPPYKYNLYSSILDIYDEIKDADVILFSSYVWNYDLCDELAQYVKQNCPKKLTILGGPHIGIKDKDFKVNRGFYDYVCRPTKPGEPFIEDFINLWFEQNGKPDPEQVSWEYRCVAGKNHPFGSTSVYEENIVLLTEMCKHADQYDLEKFSVMETTRGCPYSCAFCEWGGGIGTKVIKKDIDIVKRDLLALRKAGFDNTYLNDANFGMFEDRDIEIFEFAWTNDIRLTDISTMKAKNLDRRKRLIDRCFEIIGKDKKADSGYPTVSIQSASDEAMRIAKRVDLSYEDKVKLSEHIRDKCLEGYMTPPSLELIMAMPGSTIDDFYHEFELLWNFKAWTSYRHDYMFLPDSEISDSEYIAKYKIELVDVCNDLMDENAVENRNSFYSKKQNKFKTVISCFSYTREEMCEMFFMNQAGNFLLKEFYQDVEHLMKPQDFGKLCFQTMKELDGFTEIFDEIKDILNPNTPARSVKRILGRKRKEVIEEFIAKNKLFIINGLYERVT